MPSYQSNKFVIAVTIGDPAGIGPEVTLKALAAIPPALKKKILVIGSRACLERISRLIKKPVPRSLMDLGDIGNFRYGRLQASCGRAAIECIDKAAELLKKRKAQALVTAPVNKEAINRAGVKFVGHTEYLASKFGVKSPVMMFVGGGIKVALATRHVPLKEVSVVLTSKKIMESAEAANEFLKKFYRIRSPRIGILSLNPHAGEEGLLGDEEKKIIMPAIKKLKSKMPHLKGPLPADAAFYQLLSRQYDALVCMYHDQGMIPIKMLARNKAVNITAGLPYVRTSPVHGTAFDIAGKGKADPSSMKEAIKLAGSLLSKC